MALIELFDPGSNSKEKAAYFLINDMSQEAAAVLAAVDRALSDTMKPDNRQNGQIAFATSAAAIRGLVATNFEWTPDAAVKALRVLAKEQAR